MKVIKFFSMAVVLGFSLSSQAKGSGGFAFGGGLGITTSSQSDMNSVIKATNTAVTGVSTSEMGNAWEGHAFIEYRTSGMLALQFRPSFYYLAESSSGGYDYSYLGFTIFPIARFYLLEDKYIKFFTNLGVGWGSLNGEIKEADQSASVKFSGNNLGYLAGLGAEFCFFGSSHCLAVEANLRVIGIERMTVDSTSGTFSRGITQHGKGQELELNDRDFGSNMSGMNVSLGYAFHF